MSLGQDVLGRLPRALSSEWRVVNGIGGYASGTAAGANARAAHAHLVAADPRGALAAALLRLDERALGPDGAFELGCVVQANGTARPAGHRLLESFHAEPWPTWRYRLENARLEKSLMIVQGHNAVVVSYRLLEGPPLRLTVGPVIVARPPDPGADASAPGAMPAVQVMPGRVRVAAAADAAGVTLWHNGAYLPARAWTRVHLPDGTAEHAFLPGSLEAALGPDQPLHVVASVEPDLFRALAREARLGAVPPRTLAECVAALELDERERLDTRARVAIEGARVTAAEAGAARRLGGGAPDPAAWTARLCRWVDAGFTRRERRLTFLAGPPAAPEHGSAALRGLLGALSVRWFESVREVLKGYLDYLNDGLAPEGFDPGGAPVYGDAEPALWLVIAGERYVRRSGDTEFARDALYPALEETMRFYRSGAPGGIRVGDDGLLVTLSFDAEGLPHLAKRAAANALWSHATIAMSQLARAAGRRENAAFYLAWAHDHQQRFNQLFWDEFRGRLHDLVEDAPRPALAPDHLWAVALAPPLLPADRAARLVESIARELATPEGLRPAPGAAEVAAEWLGPWEAARLRAAQRSRESLDDARARVRAVCEDYERECTPVAASELLRLWVEDCEHPGTPVAPAEAEAEVARS